MVLANEDDCRQGFRNAATLAIETFREAGGFFQPRWSRSARLKEVQPAMENVQLKRMPKRVPAVVLWLCRLLAGRSFEMPVRNPRRLMTRIPKVILAMSLRGGTRCLLRLELLGMCSGARTPKVLALP